MGILLSLFITHRGWWVVYFGSPMERWERERDAERDGEKGGERERDMTDEGERERERERERGLGREPGREREGEGGGGGRRVEEKEREWLERVRERERERERQSESALMVPACPLTPSTVGDWGCLAPGPQHRYRRSLVLQTWADLFSGCSSSWTTAGQYICIINHVEPCGTTSYNYLYDY